MKMNRESVREILEQHWVHSHEEDTDTEMVFRPATYRFPPSRGRRSFELKPDGTLIEVGIGPTDRRQQGQGTWRLEGDNAIAFYESQQSEPKRVLHVVSAANDRLVVKK
jgi:hypothetical protein